MNITLYQNILSEITPYQLRVRSLIGFKEHRHADIELSYCIKGKFYIEVDKKRYTVREGEALLVSPMAAHLYPYTQEDGNFVLTVILGVSFLKNFFSYFKNTNESAHLFSKSCKDPTAKLLYDLLDETAEFANNKIDAKELLIRGNLYKICAYLIDLMGGFNSGAIQKRKIEKISNIEKALELIYYNYTEQITVEEAAKATGYTKSNFCKIFKETTGKTFHNMLNLKRVENASALLRETNMSISEISSAVGFYELKSFCRVFKDITSLTPNEYRKKKAQPSNKE